MLERQRLREQVKEILIGRTNAADNVTSSRATAWSAESLPAINITTPKESSSGLTASHIPSFDTVLTLNIEISVAGADGWDNALDEICEQVEDLILKNPAFVKEYSEISQYSTTLSHTDGETPIATAAMALELNYKQNFEPILGEAPFKTAHLKLPVAHDMREQNIIQAQYELENGDEE